MSDREARSRVDKWLWQARFFKTRSLSAAQVSGGHVRLNGRKIMKPAQAVGPGDVLTFAQGRRIRVVRITALARRRGPASEARALYEDLSPASEPMPANPGAERRGGRPSGKERRNEARFQRRALD